MSELAYDYQYYDEPDYEIIEGVKFIMAAARPNPSHITITNRLFSIFENYFDMNNVSGAAFVECDVHLPDEKNVFVPDVSVVCNPNIIEDNGIHGAPDLVVEVLSRSTAKRDIGIKKTVYERNGVREYWIVSPWAKNIEVYHLIDGKYELNDIYTSCTEDELNRMRDEDRAAIKTDIKVSIFDNLIVDVRRVFRWWN